MQKWMIAGIGIMLFATVTNAQGNDYKERAKAYVAKHKMLAMAEQQRTGVPAAITLGQGILETSAGNSVLALEARNHFGIKCKTTWKGETFAHTDDAPNECFRKYSSTYDSYKDHSDFLKQPRYNPLFRYPVTDYENWAKGLKKFGYATNPRYAQQLIKIIEDYNLQDYTFAANNKDIIYPSEIPDVDDAPKTAIASNTKTTPAATKPGVATPKAGTKPAATAKPGAGVAANTAAPEDKLKTVAEVAEVIEEAEVKESIPKGVVPGQLTRVNGLRAIYGLKGDVLLTYAIKQNIRYERLLEINELPDAPLTRNMYVYLDKKKTRGGKPTHTVAKGETLMQVAAAEGIQLQSLRDLNMLKDGEEPAAGAVLNLQRIADEKPPVIAMATTAPPTNKNNTAGRNTANNAKAGTKPTYIDKKTIENNKPVVDRAAAAAAREAELKAKEEQRLAAAREREEEARLERERRAEEQKVIVQTRAEKKAAEEAAAKQALLDAEAKKLADAQALEEQKALAAKAEADKKLADANVAEAKRIAAEKAAQEKLLAIKAADDAKALQAQQLAEAKAAEENKLNEEKATDAQMIAAARAAQLKEKEDAIAAEEKRIADEKAAEEMKIAEAKAEKLRLKEEKEAEKVRLAEEKAAEKMRIAEAKAAEEMRLAEEKAAEERRIAEAKAEEERKIAEAREAAERLAREKAEDERKIADAVAAEEQRIAEEKAASERRIAEAQAEKERKLAEATAKQKNRTVVSKGNEADDEFERLKSKLDKVVYATDDLTTDKIKEQEDKRIAEIKEQEAKARENDEKRIAEARAAAEQKVAAERGSREKKVEEKKVEEKKTTVEKQKVVATKAVAASKYYVVKQGDTLAGIAKKNKLTMRQIMEWNNLDWTEVTPGQKLVVKQ